MPVVCCIKYCTAHLGQICLAEGRGAVYHVHHLQTLQQLAVAIFEAMRLIDDDTAPGHTAQLGAVRQDHLKRSDNGVEFVGSLYHLALWELRANQTPIAKCLNLYFADHSGSKLKWK